MTNMGMASVRKVHPLFFVGGVISLDNSWCTTVGQRMHSSCCATGDTDCLNNISYLFQQHDLSLSATYPISSNNMTYLFQQHDLYLSTTRRG